MECEDPAHSSKAVMSHVLIVSENSVHCYQITWWSV